MTGILSISLSPVNLFNSAVCQPCLLKAQNQLSHSLRKTADKLCEIWKHICDGFIFIAAYFGSKDYSIFTPLFMSTKASYNKIRSRSETKIESGYEAYARRHLNAEELSQCTALCSMTAFINNHNKREHLDPLEIKLKDLNSILTPARIDQLKSLGFQFHDSILFNAKAGIKIALLCDKSGHNYLGYGDAGALERFSKEHLNGELGCCSKTIHKQAARQLLIGDRSSEEKAKEATKILTDALDLTSDKVTLFGQCYGGLLASYTGLSLGYKSLTINSIAFGAHTQLHLGAKLNEAKKLCTQIFTYGDSTQNFGTTLVFDWIFSRLGFRTPGCYGKKFYIPNPGYNLSKRHMYTLGCCFSSLGFDKRASLTKLQEQTNLTSEQSTQLEKIKTSTVKGLSDIE